MKTKEWTILGFLFMFLGLFFIQLDLGISVSCMQWNSDTCIILSEIYDPFIWSFYGIAVIFWIMAIISWLEKRSEHESVTHGKLVDIVLDGRKAKDREHLIKVADNLGLQQIPNDFYELAFYAKKVGKEREAKKCLTNGWKKVQTGMCMMPLKNLKDLKT